jgi:hypothetical protein
MKKLLKNTTLALLLSLNLWIPTQAQSIRFFAENFWHRGTIYFDEDSFLDGLIKFDLNTNIVQFRRSEQATIETYTARKLLYFKYLDSNFGFERSYYALPYTLNGTYETPIFFELLNQSSPLLLLAREQLQTEIVTSSFGFMLTPVSTTRTFISQNYFLMFPSGAIKPATNRKELLDYLQDREVQVQEFLKKNRLYFEARQDVINLIEFYNQLRN